MPIPSRRSFATPLLVAALLFLAGCAPTDEPVDTDPPAEIPSAADGVVVFLGIDRVSYPPGDGIQVVIRAVNRSDGPRTLTFSSAQRFDLLLLADGGQEVFRWSTDQMFAQVLGEERLPPEGEVAWEERIPAPDTPGEYRLVGIVTVTDAELEASLPVQVRR